MTKQITQTISNAPTAPDRNDPSTFPDRADSFVAYIEDMDDEYNTYATQANALATEAEANADTAETKASEAAASADAAASASNASPWDSSTTYSENDVVIGSDYNSYRSKTNSNLNNDPVTDDGTNWRNITKDPGLLLISRATASSDAAIEFTDLSSDYVEYIIRMINVLPSNNDVFPRIRTSSDNGSTFDSGASDYSWNAGFNITSSSSADSQIDTIRGAFLDAANGGFNGELHLANPSATTATCVYGVLGGSSDADGVQPSTFYGIRLSASAVDAVQIFMSSGNIASGAIEIYGVPA